MKEQVTSYLHSASVYVSKVLLIHGHSYEESIKRIGFLCMWIVFVIISASFCTMFIVWERVYDAYACGTKCKVLLANILFVVLPFVLGLYLFTNKIQFSFVLIEVTILVGGTFIHYAQRTGFLDGLCLVLTFYVPLTQLTFGENFFVKILMIILWMLNFLVAFVMEFFFTDQERILSQIQNDFISICIASYFIVFITQLSTLGALSIRQFIRRREIKLVTEITKSIVEGTFEDPSIVSLLSRKSKECTEVMIDLKTIIRFCIYTNGFLPKHNHHVVSSDSSYKEISNSNSSNALSFSVKNDPHYFYEERGRRRDGGGEGRRRRKIKRGKDFEESEFALPSSNGFGENENIMIKLLRIPFYAIDLSSKFIQFSQNQGRRSNSFGSRSFRMERKESIYSSTVTGTTTESEIESFSEEGDDDDDDDEQEKREEEEEEEEEEGEFDESELILSDDEDSLFKEKEEKNARPSSVGSLGQHSHGKEEELMIADKENYSYSLCDSIPMNSDFDEEAFRNRVKDKSDLLFSFRNQPSSSSRTSSFLKNECERRKQPFDLSRDTKRRKDNHPHYEEQEFLSKEDLELEREIRKLEEEKEREKEDRRMRFMMNKQDDLDTSSTTLLKTYKPQKGRKYFTLMLITFGNYAKLVDERGMTAKLLSFHSIFMNEIDPILKKYGGNPNEFEKDGEKILISFNSFESKGSNHGENSVNAGIEIMRLVGKCNNIKKKTLTKQQQENLFNNSQTTNEPFNTNESFAPDNVLSKEEDRSDAPEEKEEKEEEKEKEEKNERTNDHSNDNSSNEGIETEGSDDTETEVLEILFNNVFITIVTGFGYYACIGSKDLKKFAIMGENRKLLDELERMNCLEYKSILMNDNTRASLQWKLMDRTLMVDMFKMNGRFSGIYEIQEQMNSTPANTNSTTTTITNGGSLKDVSEERKNENQTELIKQCWQWVREGDFDSLKENIHKLHNERIAYRFWNKIEKQEIAAFEFD